MASVTQAWLIMTSAQNLDVLAINLTTTHPSRIIPREINNPLANNLGEGTLLGKFVAPARLLNDPLSVDFYTLCGTMPIRTIDSDILFLPVEDL